MAKPCDPDANLSFSARLVRWLLIAVYRMQGWKAEGSLPPVPKYILCGASHTSNWDFVIFAGGTDQMNICPRFMGKHTLFRWPLRGLMCGMGGVPVDRSASKGLVAQMVDAFAADAEFVLLVAAEGTRSPTQDWKTGFYRIAMATGVPIAFVGPDYRRKRVVFGPSIQPTGDYEQDMATGIAFFRSLCPRHPEKAMFPDGSTMADDCVTARNSG